VLARKLRCGNDGHNPQLFAQAMALNPTGRMAKPEEIARAAVFLASPRQAS
jgi:NAD(P)-dependent dehydrogenase (short-subunit alcohol dehydrogenase family)